jgi:MoxR-like ATPase
METANLSQVLQSIRDEVARALIGQDELVELTLIALLARGHVLIEGAPGLGKTLLVRTLSHVLGCDSRRIQFTPDLMPSDVTGGNIFNQQKSAFEFSKGPVFTQLLLADEINRAPAKTQSALLEAMQESSVTVDGVTRSLERPFIVIATQNPIESQGTYPLPEAQLDRFLFKLTTQAPSKQVEKAILKSHLSGFDPTSLESLGLRRMTTTAELVTMQKAARAVTVAESVLDYLTTISAKTREHRALDFGVSPRGTLALVAAAQARALLEGRTFVIPDDVKRLAPAALRHRIGLEPDAELEGLTTDDCINEILRETAVPEAVTG